MIKNIIIFLASILISVLIFLGLTYKGIMYKIIDRLLHFSGIYCVGEDRVPYIFDAAGFVLVLIFIIVYISVLVYFKRRSKHGL